MLERVLTWNRGDLWIFGRAFYWGVAPFDLGQGLSLRKLGS